MDVEERHETAGSETKNFITHGTVASMFACSHRRTLRELGNVCTHTGMGYRRTSSLGGSSFHSGQKACLNFAPKTVRQSAFATEADIISSKALGYANIIKKTIQNKAASVCAHRLCRCERDPWRTISQQDVPNRSWRKYFHKWLEYKRHKIETQLCLGSKVINVDTP